MKKQFIHLLLSCLAGFSLQASAGNYWQQVDAARAPKELQRIHPTNYKVYTMNESLLKL
jgi:hypothetical protein